MNARPAIVLLSHDADFGRHVTDALAGVAEVRLAASMESWALRRAVAFPCVTLVDIRAIERNTRIALREAQPDLVIALAATTEELDAAESAEVHALLPLPVDARILRTAVVRALEQLARTGAQPPLVAPAAPPHRSNAGSTGRHFAAAMRHLTEPGRFRACLLDCLAIPADAVHASLFLRTEADGPFKRIHSSGAPEPGVPNAFEAGSPAADWLRLRPVLLSPPGLSQLTEPVQRVAGFRLLELFRADCLIPLHDAAGLAGWIVLGAAASGTQRTAADYEELADAGRAASALLEVAAAQSKAGDPDRQEQLWPALSDALSHELRNPLVALKTFAQLLPERFDDPAFRTEFSRLALDEIGRIGEVVDAVEQFAHPAPGQQARIDIRSLVEETTERVLDAAKRKQLRLSIRIEQGLAHAWADVRAVQFALEQVLRTVDEALQRQSDAEIRVAVAQRIGADGLRRVAVTVGDNAPDATADQRARLLEPFSAGRIRGTGLGLATAHRALSRQGGAILVETVRTSPVFTIELPAAPESPS